MSECVYCQNTFEMNETCSDEFRMWQGLVGPYYIPSIDDLGNLSWTNTGELPNPDPVNITGKGLNIVGIVDSTDDLPDTANDFDVYLVGEEEPYVGYIYDGGSWVNLGVVGRGPQGEQGPAGVGVPTGGTTGQVLAKASGTDYDTEWVDQTVEIAVANPNLLDNWYFVGGGSQLGTFNFPINQRGQTDYQNAGGSIDRWEIVVGKAAIDSTGFIVKDSSLYGGVVRQRNNSGTFAGKTVTVSVIVSDLTASGFSIEVQLATGINSGLQYLGGTSGNSTGLYSVTVAVPDNVSGYPYLLVGINATATDNTDKYAKFKAIKLEIGDTQTLAHQENGVWVLNEIPEYFEQIEKCKRWYLSSVGMGVVGTAYDNGTVNIIIPAVMKTPVGVESVNNYDNIVMADGSIHAITNIEPIGIFSSGIMFRLTVPTLTTFGIAITANTSFNITS